MQQPPYQQQPMYQQAPPPPPLPPNYPGKQMLMISVICGGASLALAIIFSWVLSFVHPVAGAVAAGLGFVASIIGLVAAVMGGNQAKQVGIQSGLATAGLVLSIVGMVFGLILTAACSCTAWTYCQFESAASDWVDWANSFSYN